MLLPGNVHHEERCTKCGQMSPCWIIFTELETRPCICLPCLGEALGLGRHALAPHMLAWHEQRKATAARPPWWRRVFGF